MDKANTEDKCAVESGSSTSVRNTLVACRNVAKRPRKSDDDDQKSSSDSDTLSCHRKKLKKMKKSKKKKKKEKKKKESKNKKKEKTNSGDKKKYKFKDNKIPRSKSISSQESEAVDDNDSHQFGPALPDELVVKSKAMAPMSKEEWERQQSVVRRVYDEDSGRYRLMRGSGEIVEECVSRERHRQINRQATAADGLYFQNRVTKK